MYYGWWITIVGALIVGWIGGIGLLGYGVFIVPLEEQFKWDKAQLALVVTISTVISGVSSPLIGWSIDRYGPKKVLMVGVIWFGMGYIAFSQVSSLWMLYLIWPVMVNQGAHISEYAPNSAAVAKWFIRYRGRAMGILSGLGGAVAIWIPFFMVWMIGEFEWQKTALILGVFSIFYGLLLGQIHRSKPPEAYGLRPDGDTAERDTSTDTLERFKTEADAEFSVKQAIRTRSFWLLGIGNMLSGPAFSAIMLFLLPILEDKGISLQRASLGWVAFYGGAIPARFIMGPMEGRFEIRLVNSLATFLQGIGFLFFMFADSAMAIYLTLWFIGLGVGSKTPISMSIVANYFGRTNYAAIRGISAPFHTLGGALGPILMGWLFIKTGSFETGIIIASAFTVVGGILLYFAKKPKAPVAATPVVQAG